MMKPITRFLISLGLLGALAGTPLQAWQAKKSTGGVTTQMVPVGGGGDGGGGGSNVTNQITGPASGSTYWPGVPISFLGTSNVSTNHWDFGDGSALASGTSATHAYATSGTYTVTLSSTLTTTTVFARIQIQVVDRPVIGAFSSSPSSITVGDTSTLIWTVSNAALMSISPQVGAVTGSSATTQPLATTTYTLTVTNNGGSVTAQTTVSVSASATISSFTANPTSIAPGSNTTLSWATSGATAVFLTPAIGDVTGQTSYVVSPTNTATYSLTAVNSLGASVSRTLTVQVGNAGLTWTKDLLYMGDKEVAEADATGLSYTLEDHLGSPRYLVNGAGTITAQQEYLPFGESLVDSTTQGKFAKGFTGHEQTDPSGLIYMQARFYAPIYGRFLSPDPARDQHFDQTQSWNIYSYVQNDPIMRIDPTGLEEKPNDFKGIMGKGDWYVKDREQKTGRWNQANWYNLHQKNGAQEYKTKAQRAAFYAWADGVVRWKYGNSANRPTWIGRAAIVAGQSSKGDSLIAEFVLGKDVSKAATEASEEIFKEALARIEGLIDGPNLTPAQAGKWDRDILQEEQGVVMPKVLSHYSPKVTDVFDSLAKGKGPYWFRVPGDLMFSRGYIGNVNDRIWYANTTLEFYYEKHQNDH